MDNLKDAVDAFVDLLPIFFVISVSALFLIAYGFKHPRARRADQLRCPRASGRDRCYRCYPRRWWFLWLRVVLIVPTFLLFGCPLEEKKPDRTPAGWRVKWEDVSTVASGLHSKEQVYALFDSAMVRAAGEVEREHGIPAASVVARARGADAVFNLVDHWHFRVSGSPADFPNATYATGEIDSGSNIRVCFYSKATLNSTDPASVPPSAPAWMVYTGPTTGNYYWGVEVDGDQYPALGYELGHEWGY